MLIRQGDDAYVVSDDVHGQVKHGPGSVIASSENDDGTLDTPHHDRHERARWRWYSRNTAVTARRPLTPGVSCDRP
jgi:hypothetical protein